MKILHELYQVVGKKAALAQLGRSTSTSLTKQFIELLKDPNLTDEQAVKALYGKNENKKLAKYKSLKTHLRDLLIGALQANQHIKPTYKTFDEAYKTGLRRLSAIRLLIAHRAWTAARELATNTYQKVERYQIITLNRALTDLLAGMYLGANYNEKQFKKYFTLNKHYNRAATASYHLLERYREVLDMTYAHRLSSKEIGAKAINYAKEFTEAKKEFSKISGIQGGISYLEVTGNMYSGNYSNAITAANEGIETLDKCEGNNTALVNFLLITRLEAILKIEYFELGKRHIAEAAKRMHPKSINSIKVVEYAVRLGLKTGNYDFAYLAFANLNRKLISKLLTPRHQEYWQIFEAYLNFLVRAGCITSQPEWRKLPKFTFRKFFNDVPSYSRNKMGMNIPILVLQALYFIVEKKHDKVMDRTLALQRYGSRYLLSDANIRNNCFFKLLTIVIQTNFHKAATLRKTQNTYAKMVSKKAKVLAQGNETEIIPYEVLWQILLDHLE